jgi:putative ABC transport system permease protein
MATALTVPLPAEIPFPRRLATSIGLATDSIFAHKLRSFLTLLGVVIGVASVIIVGAAIEGLGVQAQQTTEKAFGSESYLIAQIASVGRMTRKEFAEKQRYNRRIRYEDYEYMKSATGDEILYSPYVQRFDDAKREDLLLEGATVIGVSASLPEIRDVGLLEGRFFTEQEERSRSFVAMVGDDIRTKLFNGENPIGKTIKLRGYDVTIVGLQEKLGSSFGRSQDNSIYIPFGAWAKIYTTPPTLSVFARPRKETGLTLDSGLDVTRASLRTRFHTKPGMPDNFEFLTPDSIRGFIDNILGLISVVVVPVTMISLVVGGIVVMNIMLVSVTERTREIGIRKALGARRRDILMQFLLEAIMVSAVGGLLGIALGWTTCLLLSELLGATLRQE